MIQVNIEIDPELIFIDKDVCKEIVKSVFKAQRIQNSEITVIFGKDELLTSLKKKHFGKDHLTDVIAFRLNNESEQQVEGEIYISLPRAKENALHYNEPFEKEISRLIIHGSLHLIGYTDNTSISKNKMTEMEEHYLGNIDWKHLLPSKKEMKNE
ncbi:MAG: rRNA maturation RNase YbeY [Candidatus Marinimicrobia bacterium]|jgi:rRNA maturation RNase YbeY|nr:rRNA maturation RNase YbeY [Candidatus Neomarinimicrobiota bacterium]|tara:strand:- start:136 stop:600 length:465 start_codon:yes stop_codon:yes gene_type:complete